MEIKTRMYRTLRHLHERRLPSPLRSIRSAYGYLVHLFHTQCVWLSSPLRAIRSAYCDLVHFVPYAVCMVT